MFAGRASKQTQDLIWQYAAPILAGVITFGAVSWITGGLFPFLEFGMAIGVTVFVRRLMRR
jgi:hypothetical protein